MIITARPCPVESREQILDLTNPIKKIVNDVNPISITLSGGEPFLRPDLPEICGKFDKKILSISTNGFDPELIYEKKILSNIEL